MSTQTVNSSSSQSLAIAAPGPLDGVTVVDWSRAVAGPYCGMLLADLGANVIKVEEPGAGDEIRQWAPAYGGDSCYFLAANRNKRSLTLNLKSAQSRVVFDRLLDRADVFIENFRPQTSRQLGFDYPTLKARNPRLVYCSITGFGPTGPLAERPAYDALLQAYTGVMSSTGEADRPPVRVGLAVADFGSALFAAYGILAALIERKNSGVGQRVELSLMESMIALMSYHNTVAWGTGTPPARQGSSHPAVAPLQVFKAADGYLLVMAGNQKHWLALCDVLEAPELKEDARFLTNTDRVANKVVLHQILDRLLLTRSRAEWGHRMVAADIPYSPVNEVDEVLQEPQALHRQMVVEQPHPQLGTMKFTGFPVKLSETPMQFRSLPPGVGEHSDEILAELGFAANEIAELRACGAV